MPCSTGIDSNRKLEAIEASCCEVVFIGCLQYDFLYEKKYINTTSF